MKQVSRNTKAVSNNNSVAIYNVEVTVLTYFDHLSIFNLLFNAPIVDFDACLTSL